MINDPLKKGVAVVVGILKGETSCAADVAETWADRDRGGGLVGAVCAGPGKRPAGAPEGRGSVQERAYQEGDEEHRRYN
jgi:hypothetical protein